MCESCQDPEDCGSVCGADLLTELVLLDPMQRQYHRLQCVKGNDEHIVLAAVVGELGDHREHVGRDHEEDVLLHILLGCVLLRQLCLCLDVAGEVARVIVRRGLGIEYIVLLLQLDGVVRTQIAFEGHVLHVVDKLLLADHSHSLLGSELVRSPSLLHCHKTLLLLRESVAVDGGYLVVKAALHLVQLGDLLGVLTRSILCHRLKPGYLHFRLV